MLSCRICTERDLQSAYVQSTSGEIIQISPDLYKDRLFPASCASSVKLQITWSLCCNDNGCSLKLLWGHFCCACVGRWHVHYISKAASGGGSCHSLWRTCSSECADVSPVNWSSVKSDWKMQPLQPRNPLCSTGPELDIQPQELLQKNVDDFSFPPVIKDRLFITLGLGDHLFGLFTILWDVLSWHLPKPSERRERKGRWFIKIKSLSWRGWVTVRTAAQFKYLDFSFKCVAAWPKDPVCS